MARVNGVIGGSGKKFFYHNDHLGSAFAVTDEYGNKVVERDFTPFGERINTDIYDETDRDADEDDSAFTGKDWDEDVGLYYYNARWYDPGVGRFISEDSVADDPNLYGYCGGNPVNNIDPTGHFSVGVVNTPLAVFGAWLNAVALLSGDENIGKLATAFNLFVAVKYYKARKAEKIAEAAKKNKPVAGPAERPETTDFQDGDTVTTADAENSDTSTSSEVITEEVEVPEENKTLPDLSELPEIPEENKPDINKMIEELVRKGASQDEIRQKIKEWALEMINRGAIYANDNESGFDPNPPTLDYADCSGSLYICYTKAGVKIQRLTAEQYYKLGKKIKITELRTGDAVAWYNPKTKNWGHIQIYLGEVKVGNTIIKDAIFNAPGHDETGAGRPLYVKSLETYTRWMQAPKYKWEPAYLDILTVLNY